MRGRNSSRLNSSAGERSLARRDPRLCGKRRESNARVRRRDEIDSGILSRRPLAIIRSSRSGLRTVQGPRRRDDPIGRREQHDPANETTRCASWEVLSFFGAFCRAREHHLDSAQALSIRESGVSELRHLGRLCGPGLVALECGCRCGIPSLPEWLSALRESSLGIP